MSAPSPEIPTDLPALATYRRRVGASEARVWENVLDWEHLPWLHRHSFRAIERLASSREGWRARVRLPPAGEREVEVELETFRASGCYVTRTRETGGTSEIWTRVRPVAPDATEVEVSFHVGGVGEAERARVGAGYVRLYTRLWDEDESMMVRRQEVLDRHLLRARPDAAAGVLALGPATALRARAPLLVEAAGVPLRIVALGDALFAHAAVCPHLGGPLGEQEPDDPCVRCPWHGYRYDVRDGRNPDGRPYRLPFARRVEVDARGEARLDLGEAEPSP
jgi:nitrite reductase/ring-hydroxylating ferredoxin subunit